ncbi:hypothetical protein DJ58_4451 [Yersinia frederiksenii ATCC 33641]|uniref:Uncharacterized protein n=1 Tax=Yersinia frederiksenii ATCC 33641 TaxID=349966 RepID=A0ABR4VY79_YERFR|nr:hypothetical protein DJ58_4451 [Yersinia frederiksenii ATCC 33641]
MLATSICTLSKLVTSASRPEAFDNLRLQSTQRSLTHHRLQCPDNGLCFPVSDGLTEVGSPGDSWFSCISGKVLFFSWNVCRTASHQDQALLPIHEKCDCIVESIYVGKNRPGIGTSSLYCADYPALLTLQLLLLSLWLSQIGRATSFLL